MKELYPEVTIIVAAYNEIDYELEKVQNCLELDYPMRKLNIFFVTDGSSDGSNLILQNIDCIRVFHQSERQGKLAAIERVMKFVHSPIVLLTDANCMLNAASLKKIVRHYQNPRVGAVTGEKRIRQSSHSKPGAGEGLYWKYESLLKRIDTQLHTVVGAVGEVFSFRLSLFEKLPPDTIIEDFVLSMRIAMKGYKVAYEPDAQAQEFCSATLKEEWKRKVRICAGGFQALKYLPGICNPFRFGWTSVQFLSHRFLRWSVIPFLLPALFAMLGILAAFSQFYAWLFGLATLCIVAGIGGLLIPERHRSIAKLMVIPGYFLLMNLAAYAGIIRYLKKTQSAVWEKSVRQRMT